MAILSELQKLYNEAGPLTAVSESRFSGDPGFVTAYRLAFDHLSANLIAEGEFDTVKIVFGSSQPDAEASPVDVTHSPPWSQALGLELAWAWELTNQQGYADGLRLQFGTPSGAVIVELVVAGSQFHLFVPAQLPRNAV